MTNESKSFEYRICCRAGLLGAKWEGDWYRWEGDGGLSAEEIESAINEKTTDGRDPGGVSRSLEEALELAAFEWWVEVRESAGSDA